MRQVNSAQWITKQDSIGECDSDTLKIKPGQEELLYLLPSTSTLIVKNESRELEL